MTNMCAVSLPSKVEPTEVEAQIRDIIDSAEHPYSRLNRLWQKGAIGSLSQKKDPTVPGNNIIMTAQDATGSITFSAQSTASSLKVAKQSAAQDLLCQVATHLDSNAPLVLETPTYKGPIRPGEVLQRTDDEIHVQSMLPVAQYLLSTLVPIPCRTDDDDRLSAYSQGLLKKHTKRSEIGIISVDLEMWERDDRINLEVGVSVVAATDLFDPSRIKVAHFINASNCGYTNMLPGLDKRYDFDHGESEFVDADRLRDHVEHRIYELTAAFDHTYLVGHSIAGDVKWLHRMGFTFMNEMTICDIARVYRWAVLPQPYNLFSMEKMLRNTGVEYSNLHNAGNDAFYGIVLFSYITAAMVFGAVQQTSSEDSS